MEPAPRQSPDISDETLVTQSLQAGLASRNSDYIFFDVVLPSNVLNQPMQQHDKVTIDNDVYGWLLEQASALRAKDHLSLDWNNLAEELEDMAALRRDALQSDLEILLLHCLKLACETRFIQRRYRERQWKLDVAEHRNRIRRLLSSSGTLRAEFKTFIPEAYRLARKDAGLLIHPEQKPIGPEQCPWTVEQIKDEDFFPSILNT